MHITGTNALVTGGASGLGLATVTALEQMRSGRTVKVLNKIRRHAPELVTVSY